MNELALFAGAGGGILGGHLLGWRTVCAVEWEPYPASVLCARQNDGFLPPFPVWDDVQTFDGKPWRGIVDVVSGGFPCQDISAAGRGEGIDGERSGMWREMARIIHEVRPRFVFVENSPMLTSRGLGRVLGDLASMGFNARWGVLGAADVGANHQRDRIWIAGWRDVFPHAELHRLGWREQQSEGFEEKNVAYTDSVNDAMRGDGQNYEKSMGIGGYEPRGSVSHSGSRCQEGAGESEGMAHTNGSHGEGDKCSERTQPQHANSDSAGQLANSSSLRLQRSNISRCDGESSKERVRPKSSRTSCGKCWWWEVEPDVGRVADGVASRVDRLKAIGNGQVSEVARRAWEVLNGQD